MSTEPVGGTIDGGAPDGAAGGAAGGAMSTIGEASMIAILAAMFGWAALSFWTAPDRFPVHWNLRGEVDRYGGRFEGMLVLPLVTLALYLLLTFLPRIDPGKRNYANFAGAYAVLRLAIVAFLGALYVFMQAAARGRTLDLGGILPFAMGALFLVLGNVMGKLRPNWFVGIRTPWTLSSAESWNRTHRAGGWVFVGLGLATMVSALLAGRAAFPITVGMLLAASLGLVVYSYVVWKDDPEKVPPAGRTAA